MIFTKTCESNCRSETGSSRLSPTQCFDETLRTAFTAFVEIHAPVCER
ncbi:MAG: hypothetical protein LBI18_03500 [Planctomycetaceae bacterium]|nr:hypothetical protein [Planctomycetaceae bacterium]